MMDDRKCLNPNEHVEQHVSFGRKQIGGAISALLARLINPRPQTAPGGDGHPFHRDDLTGKPRTHGTPGSTNELELSGLEFVLRSSRMGCRNQFPAMYCNSSTLYR